jgi:hypothetical protein
MSWLGFTEVLVKFSPINRILRILLRIWLNGCGKPTVPLGLSWELTRRGQISTSVIVSQYGSCELFRMLGI